MIYSPVNPPGCQKRPHQQTYTETCSRTHSEQKISPRNCLSKLRLFSSTFLICSSFCHLYFHFLVSSHILPLSPSKLLKILTISTFTYLLLSVVHPRPPPLLVAIVTDLLLSLLTFASQFLHPKKKRRWRKGLLWPWHYILEICGALALLFGFVFTKLQFLIVVIVKPQTKQVSTKMKIKLYCRGCSTGPMSQSLVPYVIYTLLIASTFQNMFVNINTYVIYTKRQYFMQYCFNFFTSYLYFFTSYLEDLYVSAHISSSFF